jgi:hypothetical protein
VVGGGWAGCAAAISARKAGADVILLERTDMLLGTGLVGGIMRNNGRYTAAEEMIAMGGGDLFKLCDKHSRHKNIEFPGHKHANLYDIAAVHGAVLNYLYELGVKIFFEIRISSVRTHNGSIMSVQDEKNNRFEGDVFIDATGTAGPMNNCIKYGNGCAMCILRCPSFGGRVSVTGLAQVEELVGKKADGSYGAMSGSCKLYKESLSREIQDQLNEKGVAVIPIPKELVEDHLGIKACQHIYIAMLFVVITIMAFRKDIVLPCIIGLFVMGYVSSGSLLKAVQVIYNSLIAAGTEFWGIIVIISLVVAMSKALKDIGADDLMMSPIKKLMVNKSTAFWVLGIIMMFISWFIWPSPAVALVGAIMLPAAMRAGLPAVWAAVAINLFGHGIALSGDYFIQGAPSITAKAAGIQNPFELIYASFPLWITMSVVTVVTAFIMMKKDIQKLDEVKREKTADEDIKTKLTVGTYVVAVMTPLVFLIDIFVMYKYKLKGGDATALVGGTAVLIMSVVSIIQHRFMNSLDKVTDYLKEGFMFGIKIFAPVIVIGAFFFLGSEGTAKQILGEHATGLLTDIGVFLSQRVALSKVPVVLMQFIIGGLTGLDGSGFSGLPLVGSLAQTFSTAIGVSKQGLGALGQIAAIWVGGGTIIPWAVIPVAAICNVDPADLARKNIIPVTMGFIATVIVAILIL